MNELGNKIALVTNICYMERKLYLAWESIVVLK